MCACHAGKSVVVSHGPNNIKSLSSKGVVLNIKGIIMKANNKETTQKRHQLFMDASSSVKNVEITTRDVVFVVYRIEDKTNEDCKYG